MDKSMILNATVAIVSRVIDSPRGVAPTEVDALIRSTFGTIAALVDDSPSAITSAAAEPATHEPAVSIRKSLASPDHIISLIDGKPYKTLRRHLKTHGLTPETYRARFGLKPEYPMVAESYSESRRLMAKKIGLGRKPDSTQPTAG